MKHGTTKVNHRD